jgi:hypothetical protein
MVTASQRMTSLRWWASWAVGAFTTVVVGFVLLVAAMWLGLGAFILGSLAWSIVTRGLPW